ncbi:MAG TPA: TIM barrel protein [Candidatus Methylacidiphilales bacterium]
MPLVQQAGFQSIEWGGDIHVTAGDVQQAQIVGRQTREAGLHVSAYGSYYRLGRGSAETPAFEPVLACAKALGAPTIRVWAGTKGADECSPEDRREVIEDALRVAGLAAQEGITISLEYHGGTLTDTRASVRSLMDELAHPKIEFLWQPTNGEAMEPCAERLRDVLPRLRNVHVFHWWPTAADRRPLSEGESRWRTYIDIVRQSGKPAEFLLEFVRNDSPDQFLADAATLRHLITN